MLTSLMSTSSHSFQEQQWAECSTCSDVCRAVQHCDGELAMKSVLFLAAALHPEPCAACKRWKMLQRDGLIPFFPPHPPQLWLICFEPLRCSCSVQSTSGIECVSELGRLSVSSQSKRFLMKRRLLCQISSQIWPCLKRKRGRLQQKAK